MKITLTNTDKLVVLQTEHGEIPARIWEGASEKGTPCHALITRVAIAKDATPEQSAEFADGLIECAPPSDAINRAYPRAVNLHVNLGQHPSWPRVDERPEVDGQPAWVANLKAALSLSATQGKGVAVVGTADLLMALQAAGIS